MYFQVLFAAAAAESEIGSAFSAFAAAKKQKNGEQTSATADFVYYAV